MAQEEVSLWTEIKKHEDTLAKDPLSYCFAPLAELYRKVGMLDEAVDVAIKGCAHHPDYVSGFMALGRAYFEKGLKAESREALERVVAVNHDNNLALKLLSQLYLDFGEYQLAENVLQRLLTMNPDDVESMVLLKSLGRTEDHSSCTGDNQSMLLSTERGSLTDTTDLYEIDIVEELTEELVEVEDEGLIAEELFDEDEDYFSAELPEETIPVAVVDSCPKDPLTTVTLAELYVSQGFIPSALKIYRELLSTDPDNQEYHVRCDELQFLLMGNMPQSGAADIEGVATTVPRNGIESVSEGPVDKLPPESDASSATAELELWLNNIRRMRNVI